MKLLNNLYEITSRQQDGTAHVYAVSLNPASTIYKAHFPGQPVTPGVCIIQTAVELLSDALDSRLSLAEVKNAKFLAVLTPSDSSISVRLDKISSDADGLVKAQATVASPETTYSKISFVCRKA